MDTIIKLARNKELLGTFFVTTGSLLGSFFSYLLQFFLARFLNVEEYGEFNALLSLAYIAGVPTTVLSTSLIKRVSTLLSSGDWKKVTNLFLSSFYLAFILGFIIFGLVYLLSGYISKTLQIADTTLVVLFGVWIAATFLLTLPNSFLLGLLRYKAYAFFVVLSSFLRFLVPAGLVLAGYGLTGTFTGLIISVLIAFLISLLLLRRNIGNLRNNTANISSDLSDVFKFVMPVVMVNLAMILLNNVDLVLVKKYFDAESAGYYAGVVTLGKIFLFGAGTVAVVMFPRISSLKAAGGKILNNFSLYLFLQLTVVLCGIFAYTMFPKILTLLFFGPKFLASVTYLPLFSVFVGLYVTINFLVMFLLAIDKSKVYIFLLPGVVAQYLLINFYHDSLFQIIKINISVSVLLVGAIVLYLFRLFRKDFRSTP